MNPATASEHFNHVYAQFDRLVKSICNRSLHGHSSDVDAATQAAWTRIWVACQAGQHVNKAFVSLAAQHASFDLREKANLRPEVSLDQMLDSEDEDGNTSVDTLPALAGQVASSYPFRSEMLRAAIDLLSPALKESVEEFYFEALSVREIARRHGTTENAIKVRLSEARNRLRSFLMPAEEKEAA